MLGATKPTKFISKDGTGFGIEIKSKSSPAILLYLRDNTGEILTYECESYQFTKLVASLPIKREGKIKLNVTHILYAKMVEPGNNLYLRLSKNNKTYESQFPQRAIASIVHSILGKLDY